MARLLNRHSHPTMAAILVSDLTALLTSSRSYSTRLRSTMIDLKISLTILDTSLVIIGDRVQIGPNVSIFAAGHETSVLSRRKCVEFGHPVIIEEDCWVGGNVIILPGVMIGKGSTIGAGSIVTKSIPAYSVAIGAPCQVRKTIPSVEEEERDPNNPYRMIAREV
jgi:tetrahydrodipicolinate N-succinyltransferase